MMILERLKKSMIVLAIVLIIPFCVNLFIPFQSASAQEGLDEFDAFSASLSSIIEKYDANENVATKISSARIYVESDEQSIDNQFNRLIVSASGNLSARGAVAKAEFQDLHIFQYKNEEDAVSAYEYFSDLNITVSYDAVVTCENVVAETTYTSYPWNDKSFNSWGAKYVGYEAYVENMYQANSGQLNDIVVAVLDSGINTSHELFSGRIYSEKARDFTGETNTKTSYAYEDLNGHGSHVSGIIAESTLSNVKILPLKVLTSDGTGTVSMIVSALKYVKELKNAGENIQTLNMSIGIESRNGEIVKNTTLENAILDVYACGVVPVVSAGNESMDTSYACPANIDEVITVSALTKDDYSIYFDTRYSNYGSFVDFSAPGTSILSAGIESSSDYVYLSGTSMAAPHVTACVALVYSNPQYESYGVDDVYKLLQENAVDYGAAGWDQYYGYGCINVGDVGVTYFGYVNFSVTEEFHDSAFLLTLSYSDLEGEVEILYNIETSDSASVTSNVKYTAPIIITKTTKITATAYVTSSDQSHITQSYATTQMYYFDNFDVYSNYEFKSVTTGYQLAKYNGKLTTLNVQSFYNNIHIVSVGEYAFSGSAVEVLTLPSSIKQIEQSAFDGNLVLKGIYCNGSLEIGAYAFYKCTNLSTFEMEFVSKVGNYSFAYCSNLNKLQLLNVSEIGKHALSASAIKELWIGKNVDSIGTHTKLSLTKVLGYAGTSAEDFANDFGTEFVDLTLRFTENLNSKKVVEQGNSFNLQVTFVGLDADYTLREIGPQWIERVSTNYTTEGFSTTLKITVPALTAGTYNLYVVAEDYYSTPLQSNVIEIDVVDLSMTFQLTFNDGEYDVFVDDNLMESGDLLLKNVEHSLKIMPKDGYLLRNVTINEEVVDFSSVLCEYALESGCDGLNISVSADPKTTLLVTFETKNLGEIYIDDTTSVTAQSVERENDLTFEVKPVKGYVVKLVKVNGSTILPNEDGSYTIRGVTSDANVEVIFVEQVNNVHVTWGKGGTVSASGNDVQKADSGLAYGQKRTYKISAYDGYVVDFVSVNGQIVEVKNNTFEIENDSLREDDVISVVVAFKVATGSIFAGNSVVLLYTIIFAVAFVIFVFAKIVLHFIRKKEKNNI